MLSYLQSMESQVPGSRFHIVEYGELSSVSPGKTVMRCFYTMSVPGWIPQMAIKKAAGLYANGKKDQRKAEADSYKNENIEEVVGKLKQRERLVKWLDQAGFSWDWIPGCDVTEKTTIASTEC